MAVGPFSNPLDNDPKKPQTNYTRSLERLWKDHKLLLPPNLFRSGLRKVIKVIRKGSDG